MSRLARMRKDRGVTQDEMANALGVSRSTYQHLESGDDDSPRLRYLVNAALALRCDLNDLIEDDWLTWKAFDARRPGPPEPEAFWGDPGAVNLWQQGRLP